MYCAWHGQMEIEKGAIQENILFKTKWIILFSQDKGMCIAELTLRI